jgi:hypothetical protein
MWHDRIKEAHPHSEPEYWPSSLKAEYMEAEILELRGALASPPQVPEASATGAAWRSLSDREWVNIVNSDAVKNEGSDVHGAVCEAFKLIEAKLREKNEAIPSPAEASATGAEPRFDFRALLVELYEVTGKLVKGTKLGNKLDAALVASWIDSLSDAATPTSAPVQDDIATPAELRTVAAWLAKNPQFKDKK